MSIKQSYNTSKEANEKMEKLNNDLENKFVGIIDELKNKLSLAMKKVNTDEIFLKELKKKEKRSTHIEFEQTLALLDSAVS